MAAPKKTRANSPARSSSKEAESTISDVLAVLDELSEVDDDYRKSVLAGTRNQPKLPESGAGKHQGATALKRYSVTPRGRRR